LPPSVALPLGRPGRSTEAPPGPRAAADCVAFAEVDELLGATAGPGPTASEASYARFLSSRERARWQAIEHPGRRRQWLAARLVAKHLLVVRGAELGSSHQTVWPPRLEVVRRADLLRGGCADYRGAELLARGTPRGGAPRLVWRGEDASHLLAVSLSHAGRWVAVASSAGATVGVDIELVEDRHAAFTRYAFTSGEESWARRTAALIAIRSEVLFALLWTLKEAAYKTGRFGDWSLARIEVVLEGALPLATGSGLATLPRRVPALALRLFRDGRPRGGRGAAIVTPAWVLSVVCEAGGSAAHG